MAVGVPNRDVTGWPVDRDVERLFEGRPFLYEVIADQLKVPPLRKDRRLIVQRPIFEMKDETARYAIAPSVLNEIAIGQQAALE